MRTNFFSRIVISFIHAIVKDKYQTNVSVGSAFGAKSIRILSDLRQPPSHEGRIILSRHHLALVIDKCD